MPSKQHAHDSKDGVFHLSGARMATDRPFVEVDVTVTNFFSTPLTLDEFGTTHGNYTVIPPVRHTFTPQPPTQPSKRMDSLPASSLMPVYKTKEL